MKIRCGSMDDVHPYERIHRQRNPNSNQSLNSFNLDHHTSPRQLGQHKEKKKKKEKEKVSETKMCEQIMVSQQERQHASASSASAAAAASVPGEIGAGEPKVSQRGKEEHVFQKGKEAQQLYHMPISRKLGLVEIFMGYHSLLQATPAGLGHLSRRREIYPTIGFSQDPHIG